MTTRKDAQIQKHVLQALETAGLFTDCDLDVEVEDAVVQIEGTVPTEDRGEMLLSTLRKVHGVSGVEMEVHVLHGEAGLSLEESFEMEDLSELEARGLMETSEEFQEFDGN